MVDNWYKFDSALFTGEGPRFNLLFADDIDFLEGSEGDLTQLTERLERTATRYSLEIRY